MQYLRSFLFTAIMMLSACVFGAGMGLLFFMPYRMQYGVAHWWAGWMLRLLDALCGVRFTVSGSENIPAGNHVVMCNHTSAWETIAQFRLFPRQSWVLKRELLWIPFVGWGLSRLRPIAIDRGAGHRAVNHVIEQGRQRLAEGLWVIIFPEGTRVYPGQKKKYGISGALLATQAGRLVLPVAHDAGRLWTRRSLLKKPGTVHVVIGRPIETAGKDPRQLNDEVRAAIEAALATMPAD